MQADTHDEWIESNSSGEWMKKHSSEGRMETKPEHGRNNADFSKKKKLGLQKK